MQNASPGISCPLEQGIKNRLYSFMGSEDKRFLWYKLPKENENIKGTERQYLE